MLHSHRLPNPIKATARSLAAQGVQAGGLILGGLRQAVGRGMARGAGGELVTSRGAGCRPGTAEDGLDRPIHVGLVGRPVRHRDAHRELDTAAEYAEQAQRIAAEERWTAMLPWMEAIQAELDLADGKIDQADRRLRRAWSLSLVLGDWCWQGMTARGLGLAAFARGDLPEALRWLDEAVRRAAEDLDRYAWIHAWVQEAVCRVTVTARLPRAAADVTRLANLAARSHQPEFSAQAEQHRLALLAPPRQPCDESGCRPTRDPSRSTRRPHEPAVGDVLARRQQRLYPRPRSLG